MPTCTLCSDAKPRTFKTTKSLRSHHNKYHADADLLGFFAAQPGPVLQENLVQTNPQTAAEPVKIARAQADPVVHVDVEAVVLAHLHEVLVELCHDKAAYLST